MPDRFRIAGDMMEPADKITSRPAWARQACPLTENSTPVARRPVICTLSTKAPVTTRTLPRATAGRR